MTDSDYREILGAVRSRLRELGFGMIDERIMSNMRGSDGAFWDLEHYLKNLREEVRLGSDLQFREIMQRANRYIVTETGQPLRGIRIDFAIEEVERYQMRHLDIVPNSEMGWLAEELGNLLSELRIDHDRSRPRFDGPELEL